jgi:hypothetical protein
MTARFWKWISVATLGLTVLMTDVPAGLSANISLAGVAEARLVPHTYVQPVAVVVRRTTRTVVRRTTRRTVIRRSTIYVNTLPAGCVRTSVNGSAVWRCGSTYYQPYGGTRYVVVYVN